MALRSGQSSYDQYDLSSDDKEYSMPENVAEMAPKQRDCAARLLTAARHYLNSAPELPQHLGQINPNHNDYHSDAIQITSTLCFPDIMDWWRQQEKTVSKYVDLSNVVWDRFSIIPHGVGVKDSFSLGQDAIGWRQSKTTGETLRRNVVGREFAWAIDGLLASDGPALDTTHTDNDFELEREAEQKKLHRMAMVDDILEMRQGSLNLRVTEKESRVQNNQITVIGCISDTEEIAKASWSNFQHDGTAAFKLSETSPVPPTLSAMDLPGGRTQVLTICQMKRVDSHPAGGDEEIALESVSDTENWLDWNGDLDNPNASEDDWEADNESKIELFNGVRDSQTPEQLYVISTLNIPKLIRPTRRSKHRVEKVLMTLGTMERRRSKGIKKM